LSPSPAGVGLVDPACARARRSGDRLAATAKIKYPTSTDHSARPYRTASAGSSGSTGSRPAVWRSPVWASWCTWCAYCPLPGAGARSGDCWARRRTPPLSSRASCLATPPRPGARHPW